MKEVTLANVRDRIHELDIAKHENDGGISLREEFELACLLKLRGFLEQQATPQSEISEAIKLMGFVEWLGDENLSKKPEKDSTMIKAILRDGSTITGMVECMAWQHDGGWDDIIAYKVCE